MATCIGAGFAKPAAFIAHIVITATAPASFVVPGPVTTVDATHALRVMETVKSPVRIVVSQYLSHGHKKIKHAALGQRRSDQFGCLPFAQGTARNMGMGVFLVGVEGMYFVSQTVIARRREMELDLKRA